MTWRPRSVAPETWDVLHPGVPSWLEAPLFDWANYALLSVAVPAPAMVHVPTPLERPSKLERVLQEFDLATRRDKPLQLSANRDGLRGVRADLSVDEWLDFVDFLIYHVDGEWLGDQRIAELTILLARAGSEWTVGEHDGHRGLVKRVPDGVAVAAKAIIESQASAGTLLGEAWHAVFGRNPDPEVAYAKAVKAVEEAGWDKVSPKNERTSLGTMIRDMKAQPHWLVDLPTPDADVPVKMAEALWVGQEGRHGGNGYRTPTPSEAEAAVLLAVPLVQWFSSGALARRP